MGNYNYTIEVGDVVLVKEGGWGLHDKYEGKYVEVISKTFDSNFNRTVFGVKSYDQELGDDYYSSVLIETFGENPVILLNVNEERVDEDHVAVAEGSAQDVDKALGIDRSVERDMVNKPSHYQLFHKDEIEGDFIEVKHVVKAVLQSWQEQDKISFDFYQAGCYKELLQYLLRAPLKNNIEDVQKAEYYLKEIINEW